MEVGEEGEERRVEEASEGQGLHARAAPCLAGQVHGEGGDHAGKAKAELQGGREQRKRRGTENREAFEWSPGKVKGK